MINRLELAVWVEHEGAIQHEWFLDETHSHMDKVATNQNLHTFTKELHNAAKITLWTAI